MTYRHTSYSRLLSAWKTACFGGRFYKGEFGGCGRGKGNLNGGGGTFGICNTRVD